MSWLTIPLLVLITSCASMDPGRSYYDVTHMPPTQGQQMDMDSFRDYKLDRLR